MARDVELRLDHDLRAAKRRGDLRAYSGRPEVLDVVVVVRDPHVVHEILPTGHSLHGATERHHCGADARYGVASHNAVSSRNLLDDKVFRGTPVVVAYGVVPSNGHRHRMSEAIGNRKSAIGHRNVRNQCPEHCEGPKRREFGRRGGISPLRWLPNVTVLPLQRPT